MLLLTLLTLALLAAWHMARRRGHGLVMFVSHALGTCVYGPWVWRPASWVMYVLLLARTRTRTLCFYSCSHSHSLSHSHRTLLTDTLMTEPGLPLCRNSSRAETTIEEFRCAKSRQERGQAWNVVSVWPSLLPDPIPIATACCTNISQNRLPHRIA